MRTLLPTSLFEISLSTLLTTILLAAMASVTHAQSAFDNNAFASNETTFLPVEEAYSVNPRLQDQQVIFSWNAEDGYYLYRHQFSLVAVSPNAREVLEFSIPDGLRKYDENFQEELEVYYGSVDITAKLPVFDGPYELQLTSQGCADAGLCYPPRTQYFSVIEGAITETPVSTVIQGQSPETTSESPGGNTSIETSSENLLIILLGAALGGMILNLMPCVFPVLSLKALHLATGSAEQHRINGWAYTAGVTLSFAAVGAIIVAAKSAGSTLGWGFQLQQPVFVAGLIYLFFLLSLNLFGLFEIGTNWMGIGNSLTQGDGAAPSFFTGVLAAVVASPCTAPFMATAIGYTLTQGSIVTMAVFVSLGLGMALPLLLLSHSPHIANKLPSPGPWMNVFKQFLAFPLLFTCVWLLVVIGNQTDAYTTALIVGGMVCIAMACWLLNQRTESPLKWFVRIFALALFAVAMNIAVKVKTSEDTHSAIGWQDYSAVQLNALRASNTPVFIDATADWCITCKINEKVAINVDKVQQFANDNGIVMMRADWTKPNPEIKALLNSFNRNGVPLYLMYGSDGGEPEILPQILTPSIVLEAMNQSI